MREVEEQSYKYTQKELGQPLRPVTGPLTVTVQNPRVVRENQRRLPGTSLTGLQLDWHGP